MNINQLHDELQTLVIDFAIANEYLSNPHLATGGCFTESSKLELAAKERGMLSSLVRYSSGYHFAAMIDGVVIDFTARQFDFTTTFPWIGTQDEWLEICVEWRKKSEERTRSGST